MMGRQMVDQSQLFYLFNLEEQIPADHLLRRLNPIVTRVLVDLRTNRAVAITSYLVRIVNENIRGVSQFDSGVTLPPPSIEDSHRKASAE